MNNKKAQSAMEYLMTYGWAILVVLIALGALFYLGVFNPKTVNTCTATAPISCTDIRASGTSVEFSLGVTGASSATAPLASATAPALYVNEVAKTCTAPVAPATPTALSSTAQTKVTYTCPAMAKNDKFRGSIAITYQLQGSTVTHTGNVDFSGTVEA